MLRDSRRDSADSDKFGGLALGGCANEWATPRASDPERASLGNRDESMSCAVCDSIFVALQDNMRSCQRLEGTLEDLVQTSGCSAHGVLIAQAAASCRIEEPWANVRVSVNSRPSVWMPDIMFKFKTPAFVLAGEKKYIRKWESACFRLLGGNGCLFGRARLLDANWVDDELPWKWKDICESHHGDKCSAWRNPAGIYDEWPSRVIDVSSMCLVSYPEGAAYVALSYVWGAVDSFLTTAENLDKLQRPGALSRPEVYTRIPRTIQDAIGLTSRMRERYLWVDALCVLQGGISEETQKELEKMASIYAHASVTIIAAAGKNADHGLRGLRGISQPRSWAPDILTLRDGRQLVQRPPPMMEHALWPRRAWTFQEGIFSHRQLVFFDQTIYWYCVHHSFLEDIHLEPCLCPLGDTHAFAISPALGVNKGGSRVGIGLTSELPLPLQPLLLVMNTYNGRELTYPEDRLRGFAGISKVMCRDFEGGFLSGLPVACFTLALLWRLKTPMTRRRLRTRSSAQAQPACLPSWSWVGWQSSVDSRADGRYDEYPRLDVPMRGDPNEVASEPVTKSIVPLVAWYSHESPKWEGYPVVEAWLDSKKQHMSNTQSTLPPRWSRHILHNPNHTRESDYVDFAASQYTGRIKCYDTCRGYDPLFLYPIPLPDPDKTPPLKSHPFLSCRTRRAFLRAGAANASGWMAVYGKDNSCVGWVESYVCHAPAERETIPQEHMLELVEIAEGYITVQERNQTWMKDQISDLIEFKCGEVPVDEGVYKYIWVFWIEWEDGIAERKGIGRMFRTAWDAELKELVDLMLG